MLKENFLFSEKSYFLFKSPMKLCYCWVLSNEVLCGKHPKRLFHMTVFAESFGVKIIERLFF